MQRDPPLHFPVEAAGGRDIQHLSAVLQQPLGHGAFAAAHASGQQDDGHTHTLFFHIGFIIQVVR